GLTCRSLWSANRHHWRRPLKRLGMLQPFHDLRIWREGSQDQIKRSLWRRQPVGFLVRARIIGLQVEHERTVAVLFESAHAAKAVAIDRVRDGVAGGFVVHRE